MSRIVNTFNYLWKLIGTMLFYSLASGQQISKVAFSLPVGLFNLIDLLSQMIFGSFFFMLIISVMLYLPQNWYREGSQRNNIMVGAPCNALNNDHAQLASGVALMSLLREGGQWDTDGMHIKSCRAKSHTILMTPRCTALKSR